MRILFVINSLGVGGAERVVVTLADRLVEQGHDAAIVYLQGPTSTLPSDPRVKLFEVGLEKSIPSILTSLPRFLSIIKSYRPDIINAHLFYAVLYSRILRPFYQARGLVSSFHNTAPTSRLKNISCRITGFLSDLDINVSRHAVESYLEAGAVQTHKARVIYNGIDTRKFLFSAQERVRLRNCLGCSPETNFILSVGSLTEQKDYPTLLRCVSLLQNAEINFMLFIAGEGPCKGDLMQLTEKLGLQQNVRFLGNRDDIPSLMSAADVFVLSSAWEGFGLVLAEALACSCLVVSTRFGCVEEVIGEEGLLAGKGKAVELHSAIIKSLNMEPEAKFLTKERGRERVEQYFSQDLMVEKYVDIFEGLT